MKLAFVLLTALLLAPLTGLHADETIEIGSRRQLFLDDYIIEEVSGLKRTMHQPVKRGPVLKGTEPWEGEYIAVFSPPMWIPDEGLFKQVYECRGYFDQEDGRNRYALATSKDGVRWEKPRLGIVEFNGSKQDSLFPTPDNRRLVHVTFDPDDPDPTRRYKGLLTVPRGHVPVVSADCLHWTTLDTQLPSSDAGTMAFDRDRRLFMVMLKRGNPNTVGRSYDVSFSDDFIEWSEPRFMFGMDKDRDQSMALDVIRRRLGNPALAKPLFIEPHPSLAWQTPAWRDELSSQAQATWRVECYNFGVVPYEGLYLGLITAYYATGTGLPEKNNTDGFNLIQLAVSRDLKEWKRLGDRRPFLEPSPLTEGLVGNYDRLQLGAYNGIIQHKREVWFYYGGMKRRVPQHDRWLDGSPRQESSLSKSERADWLEDTHSAMHLAVLRRDGFISLDAEEQPGELVTKPFVATGSQLLLNLCVREGGHARVAVLDNDHTPITGYDLEDCVLLKTDAIDQAVSWKSGAEIRQLNGKTVRMRIELKNADLYSFQFAAR